MKNTFQVSACFNIAVELQLFENTLQCMKIILMHYLCDVENQWVIAAAAARLRNQNPELNVNPVKLHSGNRDMNKKYNNSIG